MKIIFRLDDIQGFYLNKTQIEIIDAFLKHSSGPCPINLGLIGYNFIDDSWLSNEVIKRTKEYSEFIEIACHTWSHKPLIMLSKEEQIDDIKEFKNKIQPLFKQEIITLIAPENYFNEDTYEAMFKNDLSILSSVFTVELPFQKFDLGNYPISIPANILGSHYPNPEFRSPEILLDEILQLKSENAEQEIITVVLHPSDFFNGNQIEISRIKDLSNLIQSCKDNNLELTKFSDFKGIT
jgi:peptidoglycan/xylan/chitin deacetylase (PgdA/CDA1 family)